MIPSSHSENGPLAEPGQGPHEDSGSSGLGGRIPRPVPIADHHLIRCIGRGSYGQVWLARNMMGAYRAVKVVYRGSFDSQRPFERELSGIKKFEPISRLHEGFIDVLQVGINEDQGYFYYVMELGDDQCSVQEIDPEKYKPRTLAREISVRGRLSLQECLRLGLAISDALADLHKHGLVHRDIKPSNIIFVNGAPKLADIGLVARMSEARSYVGTVGFIPPEGAGSPQADIYSLGKVLYEVSTARDRQDFPELPTHWSESVEYNGLLELNEIVLQACKPEAAKRYPTASDMHADLLVVLNGKSVRRLRFLERRMTHLKRTAGLAALIAAASALVLFQIYREWNNSREARQRQVDSNVNYGNRFMESGDLLGSLPYFAEALRLDQGNADRERTHRLRFGSTLAECPRLIQLWMAPMRVNDGQFSPDGQKVLFAEHFWGRAEVHDLNTGQLYLKPFGPKHGLTTAAYSPDGRFIVTSSQTRLASIWDATTLTNVIDLHHPNKLLGTRFAPDSRHIVTCCLDGVARVWDVATGHLDLSLIGHTDAVLFATFSNDGRMVATGSRDGTARIWDATTGKPISKVLKHSTWVNCVAFSPDNLRLATACTGRQARVWELSGRELLPELEHNDVVASVEFSPDGLLILTASYDGTARLWRADDLQPITSNPVLRHGERVTNASFSPDGRLVLTTCNDGSVRVWDLAATMMPPIPVNWRFSTDATRYLTLSNDCLQVWNTSTGQAASPPIHPQAPLKRADLSYDGRFVFTLSLLARGDAQSNHLGQVWITASGQAIGPGIVITNTLSGATSSEDGTMSAVWDGLTAQLFDNKSGTCLRGSLLHKGSVSFARFAPRGDRLVTVNETNVFVWDIVTGRLAFPALELPVPVGYVDFSRDGRNMVTCCSDPGLTKCFAQVWRISDGHRVGETLDHADGVLFAAFSRNGTRIVTAGEDYSARVWETKHYSQLGLPLRHRHQVWGAGFSSDTRWVATASSDKTARVWDTERNDPLTPPLYHPATLLDVKFLPGDRGIVTADREGRSWIWPLRVDTRPPAQMLALAEFLSGIQVTPRSKSYANTHLPLEKVWRQLRREYPKDFSTSCEDVVAWHKLQAEESEFKEQWFAAVFHLKYLLSFAPDDESLLRRLALANEHLTAGDSPR